MTRELFFVWNFLGLIYVNLRNFSIEKHKFCEILYYVMREKKHYILIEFPTIQCEICFDIFNSFVNFVINSEH